MNRHAPVSAARPSVGEPTVHWREGTAFSLVELLMVIAVLAILAGLLLPSLSKAKVRGQRIQCMSNLRQLGSAWAMYAADNLGALVGNYPILSAGLPHPDNWFWGYASWPHDPFYGPFPQYSATSIWCATSSKLFPYHGNIDVARCPADTRVVGGLRIIRSVSMNSWINGRSFGDPTGSSTYLTPDQDRTLTYRLFRKEAQLIRPAETWLMIDEDANPAKPSINDSMFVVDMGAGPGLADLMARRHGNAYGLSFTDGHSEIYSLRDPRTIRASGPPVPRQNNPDWAALARVTTQRN